MKIFVFSLKKITVIFLLSLLFNCSTDKSNKKIDESNWQKEITSINYEGIIKYNIPKNVYDHFYSNKIAEVKGSINSTYSKSDLIISVAIIILEVILLVFK